MVRRYILSSIVSALDSFPVVAILGPRQVGKSVLAKTILTNLPEAKYLDLEKPADLNILENPEFYFKQHVDSLICIDEIQRSPELFPLLRAHIDAFDRKPRFLILGSASPHLLKQSSESLAGRIKYFELGSFSLHEIDSEPPVKLWVRGGFPLSFLAKDDAVSFEWRDAFVKAFIERDLSLLGFNRSPQLTRRIWTILCHNQGQLLNKSKISQALDVTAPTIQSYIDMLEDSFMIRVLRPLSCNTRKRLVKSPKVYIRDSGLLHSLLGLETLDDIIRHPIQGMSWEGFVVEQICMYLDSRYETFFYRSATGEEIDLILKFKNKTIAIEIKTTTAPALNKHNHKALEYIHPDITILVSQGNQQVQFDENKWIVPVSNIPEMVTSNFEL
jgi:predicted AAA+ superfamily ATPase